MDTGAGAKQPSMLSLAATALLCAVTVAWAYRDRLERMEHASAASDSGYNNAAAWPAADDEFAPYVPAAPLEVAPAIPAEPTTSPPATAARVPEWPGPMLAPPRVVSEPPVELPPSFPSETWSEESSEPSEDLYEGLGPEDLTPEDLAVDEQSVLLEKSFQPTPVGTSAAEATESAAGEVAVDDTITPLAEDPAALAAAYCDPRELLTYTPSASEISLRVAPDVQAAFALGRHGALFAARGKFLDAMRQIATAKDGQSGVTRHTDALDEALIALDEAQDFLPGGVVSKEISVEETAASHRTPMLRLANKTRTPLPHEAAALYYRYAEQKLATAVQGEQAGSMALYGLGKTYAQLHKMDDLSADQQRSLAMYRAAVLAHPANHLAANELGVGLAAQGHYQLAESALHRAAKYGGGSTVYRNLAMVQHKLGQPQLAAETSQRAERLAMQERAAGVFSRERGVQWVPPQRMAGRGAAPYTAAQPPAPQQQPQPRQAQQRGLGGMARRVLYGDAEPRTAAYQVGAPLQANPTAAPVGSQTTFR